MVQLKVASMFFFSGLAVVIALVVVVYVVAWVYDRASGTPEALLTVTELEERRIASTLVKDAGLAGLLPDEKNRVLRHFFQEKSSAYAKQHDIETPPDSDVVKNRISSPTEDKARLSENGMKVDTCSNANSKSEKPVKNEERGSKKRKSRKTEIECNGCNCCKADTSKSKQSKDRWNDGSGYSCYHDSQDVEQAWNRTQSTATKQSKVNRVSEEIGKAGQSEEGNGIESTTSDGADKETEEGVCPICLVEFENDENVIGGSCGHMFHFECLMQWFEKSHSDCPMCRSDMMTAENFLASAYDVLGEQRVNKLKHINEQAARRLEALEANHHRETTREESPHAHNEQPAAEPVDPTVGRDPPARLAPTATADTSRLTIVMVQ